MNQKLMMAKAGAPQTAASASNHSGGTRPVGPAPNHASDASIAPMAAPSIRFMRPPSASKTQRQSTLTPTPASTLGRYQAARQRAMPRTFRFMRSAAPSAIIWPPGTAMSA